MKRKFWNWNSCMKKQMNNLSESRVIMVNTVDNEH